MKDITFLFYYVGSLVFGRVHPNFACAILTTLFNFIRQCITCKSFETYTNRKGEQFWYKDDQGAWICSRCKKRIDYNRERIRVDNYTFYCDGFDPRLGVCSDCGRSVDGGQIGKTCLCIHESGIDARTATLEDVLDVACEFCLSCHKKYHPEVEEAMQNRSR